MPFTTKSYMNPYFSSLFTNNSSDYFNYTMTNIMDNFYKTSMQTATDGKFKAIVLSGLLSGETLSSTYPSIDLRTVKGEDGEHYYEVKVRPIDVTRGLIVPDPCERGISDGMRLSLIEMHEWARSEFSVTRAEGLPLVAAQEIVCYYEKGSISNSNFSRLRFEMPLTSVIRLDCLISFGIDTSTSQDLFTGLPVTLANYATIGNMRSSDQAINDSDIVQGDQIPGTILPFDYDDGIITSIMGPRVHPITGEIGKLHRGVDVGMPKGKPLYAIADGVVSVVNRNSSGFGYLVGVKHTMNNSNGESKTFHVWYGHVNEILVKHKDVVTQGSIVATCGNRGAGTGPHLHFEFHEGYSGSPDRLDPIAMFGWYSRVKWQSEDKTRWESENPNLVGAVYEEPPPSEPPQESDPNDPEADPLDPPTSDPNDPEADPLDPPTSDP